MVLLIKTIESSTVYCDMKTGLWGWTWGPPELQELEFFSQLEELKKNPLLYGTKYILAFFICVGLLLYEYRMMKVQGSDMLKGQAARM